MVSLSGYFDKFTKDPDPANEPRNIGRRWRWPPPSKSPFTKAESREGQASSGTPTTTSLKGAVAEDDTPHWVHLLYDLAWTAALSSAGSLVSNSQIRGPWGVVSYIIFFLLLWWLWASQAVYAVHFYTNDLFHSVSLVVQLCIFGLLASTIRGCDITNYILHSPGTDILEPEPGRLSDITDSKIYRAELMATSSLKSIAILVVISRVVHLLQYIRAIAYALTATPRAANRVILKMCMVPLSLIMSISLFASTIKISTSADGRTPHGAKRRLALGGVALLIEAISVVIMPVFDWHSSFTKGDPAQSCPHSPSSPHSNDPPLIESGQFQSRAVQVPEPSCGTDEPRSGIPDSNITLPGRLEGVTTIVLGEGINGITSSLYTVLSAPWSEKSVPINAISTAIIICSIVYFYFEGTSGPWRPKGFHESSWLFMHLPFLLTITLLLLGMQKQLLLSSFLYIAFASLEFIPLMEKEGVTPINPSSGNNSLLEDHFLERGFIWREEWQNLINKTGPIVGGQLNQSQALEVIAWKWELALKTCVDGYEILLGENRKIPDALQSMIELYVTNQTVAVADNHAWSAGRDGTIMYYQILDNLTITDVMGVRYIIGLAGCIICFLGLFSLVRSKPQDRFHWGIILSRLGIGLSLNLLLVLNLGRYQTIWVYPEYRKYQAGVFQWMATGWVLPTIALAFVVEIIVELVITWLAKLRLSHRKKVNKTESPAERPRLHELVRTEAQEGARLIWNRIASMRARQNQSQ